MDHTFQEQFRAEMDAFRKDFQKDRLEGNGCDARTHTGARRERCHEEFHDTRVDFQKESGEKGIDQDNEKGSLF